MNASRPEKTLKPNQRIALLALANGERPRFVAARAGVSVATLYRWRRNPVFQQALDAALDNYHENFPQEEAAARIFAFQALTKYARSAGPRDQIRAATTLLKYLGRSRSTKKSHPAPPGPISSTT
jgi:hypothetical protein